MTTARHGLCTILLALLAATMAANTSCCPPPISADMPQSQTFLSSPNDGHLRQNGDDGWDALKDSQAPAEVFDDLRYVKINTRDTVIYRGYLFFDTSSLPDSEPVTGAVLHIYSKCTGDLDDCQLYILAGTEDYPHMPLQSGDYALPKETLLECAHVDVGGWTQELAYRTIQLNNTGTTIDTTGITRLCLLERRDQEDATPPDPKSENELKLYSFEEGEGFQPYLEVFWGGPMPASAVNPADDETGQQSPATAESNTSTIAINIAAALCVAAAVAFLISRRRKRSR
ncbi:MAG: hypothetical protein KAQ74_01740 [Dehalococcoidia bacterium]|nr:hypothetical protein [Dehalococcoidia bacterium]